MAGLYDRVRGNGLDGRGSDRVNVHLISEAIVAYTGNVFSKSQIIDVVNNQLADNGWQPLRPEDIQDLDAIVDAIDAKASTTQKLVYAVCQLGPVMIAAELEEIPEAQWRSALEIT